jgi:hypothetical protein
MQQSAVGKIGSPDCRIPHRPLTPRALNQTQQRNLVRQWMGLPPTDTRLQRASRQIGLAADHAMRAAGNALARVASQAAAGLHGMHAYAGASLLGALPDLHIGPPGAAAKRDDLLFPAPAVTLSKKADCKSVVIDALAWEEAFPNMSTVDELLAACPGAQCSDDASGDLQGVTVVVESGERLRELVVGLAERGATVLLSPGSVDALGDAGVCLDKWFGSAYERLDNVTPADWAPAGGGAVVLLSPEEFAGRLAPLHRLAYPSCVADALACLPGAREFPAPALPRSNGGDTDNADVTQGGRIFAFISVSVAGLAGLVVLIKLLRNRAVPLLPGAVAAPAATIIPMPASAASQPASQTAAPVPASTVVTAVSAQLQQPALHHDATHPPAGQPGGD